MHAYSTIGGKRGSSIIHASLNSCVIHPLALSMYFVIAPLTAFKIALIFFVAQIPKAPWREAVDARILKGSPFCVVIPCALELQDTHAEEVRKWVADAVIGPVLEFASRHSDVLTASVYAAYALVKQLH